MQEEGAAVSAAEWTDAFVVEEAAEFAVEVTTASAVELAVHAIWTGAAVSAAEMSA